MSGILVLLQLFQFRLESVNCCGEHRILDGEARDLLRQLVHNGIGFDVHCAVLSSSALMRFSISMSTN